MKRASLLVPALFLVACTNGATDPSPSTGTGAVLTGSDTVPTISSSSAPDIAIKTETVDYGPTDGYLAMPDDKAKHPAIILIHEWWGLNDNIRWYAEQFAKQGYVALAVNLYEQPATEDRTKAGEMAAAVRANLEPAFANLNDAVAYLKTRPEVQTDNLASVGWCFGGGWSYQMAKNDLGVKASVMYYGQFAPEDDLEMMKAHIMGHFGENDTGIPVDDVKAFRAKLETKSGENQIFIYENVGHGFAKELNTPSAQQAWDRTLEFLDEQL